MWYFEKWLEKAKETIEEKVEEIVKDYKRTTMTWTGHVVQEEELRALISPKALREENEKLKKELETAKFESEKVDKMLDNANEINALHCFKKKEQER